MKWGGGYCMDKDDLRRRGNILHKHDRLNILDNLRISCNIKRNFKNNFQKKMEEINCSASRLADKGNQNELKMKI